MTTNPPPKLPGIPKRIRPRTHPKDTVHQLSSCLDYSAKLPDGTPESCLLAAAVYRRLVIGPDQSSVTPLNPIERVLASVSVEVIGKPSACTKPEKDPKP